MTGDNAVKAFNMLRLADVPGTPSMAVAGADWMRDIVRALFGSVNARTLERYIQELFILVPKKNSKTSSGALVMLTALLLNQRPRAEFLFTAPVQETAETAFSAAAGAIALDPVLSAKLHVREHLKTIVHRVTKATLEIITFEPSVITGRKVSGGALIDELHVLGKMPRAAKALLQLRGGMQPFPESFLITITTQSDEPPAGVFKEELTRARAVRDGERHGDTLLPVLYEFSEEMQKDPARPWRDPKNWRLVNPNAGKSISIDRLVRACETEEQKGQEAFRLWASQHLNIEIGIALRHNRWAGVDFWEQCCVERLELDDLIARSDVITFGIDGGGLDDMLGAAAVGRDEKSGKWLGWTHAWIHPIVLDRHKAEADLYRQFEREGDLTIVQHVGDDVEEVADIVDKLDKAELLDNIGVDTAGIGDMVDAIVAKKIDEKRIIGIPQGWKLVGTIKTAERKLAGNEFEHGPSSMMKWCVGNAKVEPRGNAYLITKQVSGSAKIDPLMALFNAKALMSMGPKPRKKKFQAYIF